VECRALDGRLERRLGRGRGLGHGPARTRQRRRRLHPHSGRLLRTLRPQAHARAQSLRSSPRRRDERLRQRDSAALLDATAGPDVGDPYWAPPQERPYLQEVGADPGRLRIAFTTEAATGVEVHKDCVEAVRDVAKLCEELGHQVEEANIEVDGDRTIQAFTAILTAGGAGMTIEGMALVTGRTPTKEQFEPLTWALYEMSRGIKATDYLLALTYLQQISRLVARFMIDYDVWLTPTLSKPPAPLGWLDSPPDDPMLGLRRATEYAPFTPICNFTGQPAMSAPLVWNAEGLPVGTHFIGRFGDEATLLRLAAQLEQARPWAGRRPPIAA
jgi:amidase